MRTGCVLTACLFAATALPAVAQINWNDNPADWPEIKQAQGKVSKGLIDFDDDPDYGIVGFSGPLTSAGAGPVSPGVVLDNVVIDTVVKNYNTNLAALGPSGGFGNPSNAILANYFVDSLEISFTEPNYTMVMLDLLVAGGRGSAVIVRFYDKNDILIGKDLINAPREGHPVLFWTENRSDSFGRITIESGRTVAGGIMQSEYWVPEPVTLSLLALGGAFVLKRRR